MRNIRGKRDIFGDLITQKRGSLPFQFSCYARENTEPSHFKNSVMHWVSQTIGGWAEFSGVSIRHIMIWKGEPIGSMGIYRALQQLS